MNKLLMLCALTFAALLFVAEVTTAKTFTVTTNTDTNDAATGNGMCADAENICTLRAAIEEANALTGDDRIDFAADLANQTIRLQAALTDIDITSNVVIDAAGVSNLTVSGGDVVRVFNVGSGASVILSGLIIKDGFARGDGGAITNFQGTLNIINSIVSNSYSEGGSGIYNMRGTLNITDSVISGNSGGIVGGILSVGHSLTIVRSTVTNNFGGRSGLGGGGIYIEGSVVLINDSTISHNSSEIRGGGIHINGGRVDVTNCTITNNKADYEGGGIFVVESGSLVIVSSTIVSNVADFISFGTSGGGIYNGGTYNFGFVSLRNTIVALNKGAGNPDLFGRSGLGGRYISRGYNLILKNSPMLASRVS